MKRRREFIWSHGIGNVENILPDKDCENRYLEINM